MKAASLFSLAALTVPLWALADQSEFVLAARSGEAPFADAGLPQDGMVVELVTAAFASGPSPLSVRVSWVAPDQEWPTTRAEPDGYLPADVPECDEQPTASAACSASYYSDALVDLVVLLFVRVQDEASFAGVNDLADKRICYAPGTDPKTGTAIAPAWLSERKIKPSLAVNLSTCFRQLAAGQVDGVAADEFRGIRELFRQDLTETVVPMTDPLGSSSLHLAISKSHWRATAHLYRVNAGLVALRRSGAYAEIVARHTAAFWAELKN